MTTPIIDRHRRLERARSGTYDVVVVGGGITGAGVFRLAAQMGLRVLLLEQRDFAWGTSSRSSKLVHGGIRYLMNLQVRSSMHSVRERERLLRDFPGLVEPLTMLAVPPGGAVGKWGLGAVLAAYDLLAGRRSMSWCEDDTVRRIATGLRPTDGAWRSQDASTDDARLVLRVLAEGGRCGGVAVNYVRVTGLLRGPNGIVDGVEAEDSTTGLPFAVPARVVVNATGAWADELAEQVGRPRVMRPLRGSHLIVPWERLPVKDLVGTQHPDTGMRGFVTPWEGCTLVAITDLDHDQSLDREPGMSYEEGRHLLDTANHWFPQAHLTADDVIATMAGVRPVIGTGKDDPSKESREEAVWADQGMVTVAGGKLTTFAFMARRALEAAGPWLGSPVVERERPPEPAPPDVLADPRLRRLFGRYGQLFLDDHVALADDDRIGPSIYTWAELRLSAGSEAVVHLDDLLLRRLRLGIVLRDGAAAWLPRIRTEVQPMLGWDDDRWLAEEERYLDIWSRAHGTAMLDVSTTSPVTKESIS